MPGPSLFAGSILGLRSWSVRIARDGQLRLCASYGDSLWESGGRWTEAKCLSGTHRRRDPVPGQACSCGLYALHPHLEQAREHESAFWEEMDGSSPEPEELLELGEISGLVEACGRIEVHESGFRAERARPAVLLVGRSWSALRRRGVEQVARLHGAQVLEIGCAEELVEYCERRGGALDPGSVAELLEPVGGVASSHEESPTGWTPPASPPAEDESRLLSALHMLGNALLYSFVGLLALLWYGFWAAVVVGVAGAIFFGWGDEKPWRAPARVDRVIADRSKCRVDAVVRARRSIQELHLRIVAISHSGKDLARTTRAVGAVPKGRSSVHVAWMRRRLCDWPAPLLIRVRAVYGPLKAGHVAQTISRPTSGVRKPGVPATKSRS
ncbi:MAG: hypothetical protein WB771_01865 [Solirubrobacterales bacterium]